MKLYEFTQEAQALYDALTEQGIEDEEREQIISDTMEAMGADEKLESYCQIIRQMEADMAVIDDEMARLGCAKKRRAGGIDRMKDVMLSYYEATGLDTPIDAGTFRISRRRSEGVVITDEALVPDHYYRIKREPDKAGIKKGLKAGEEIPGAALEERWSIQIK